MRDKITVQTEAKEAQTNTATPAPVVSVVMPTYKRPDLVRKAVLSLFNQDFEKDRYEIIVVDSSPDDRNASVVTEMQSSAPCPLSLLIKKPEGPGPSRSLGVQHARGRFIAFMDSDCQATPGWLRAGLQAFGDEVGLVQGKTQPDPAGHHRVFTWYVRVERENFIYECCNIFYRREALRQVGEFRPSLNPTSDHPPSGEDVEMAWRIKKRGWKSSFAPQAVVYHEVVPIPLHRWLVNEQLFIVPYLTKNIPELRQIFFTRHIYDRAQACLILALVGMALTRLTPIALILCLPYLLVRVSEPTSTLKGVLRPLRVLVYFPRDAMSFLLLVAGSLRYRSLVL